MTAAVLSIASRQSQDVQRRAVAAVTLQRERRRAADRNGRSLAAVMGDPALEQGIVGFPSLDDWYRAQPVPRGRTRPVLRLSADEKRLYGLPPSAKLVDLRGVGSQHGRRAVIVGAVQGGFVVGVKAPDGTGVGVLWRKSYRANDYALRLSAEHSLPLRDRWS